MTSWGVEVFERAVDVLVLAVGVGCAWQGWRPMLLPRRSLTPTHRSAGSAWMARAWGLGMVLTGLSLTAMKTFEAVGGRPDWPVTLMVWVAGPLVLATTLAGVVIRWGERGRGRAGDEGRQT
ncbi:hypothetical protein SUDANB15_07430 (plasmid) [Streptomyces sp. enrichment culture]|uniref:hypothetical protein n=1 Tax=Streptomyces sp. enrichment culture TaxID=1795815 RepID=UPI003F546DBA